MGNLSKVILQSSLAFLVAGSIYTGEIQDISVKIDELRKSSPIIGINTELDTSQVDFKDIFGKAGKEQISDLEIYYIPLKNGEATLIKTDGKNILVNTGDKEDVKTLKSFIENHEVNRIDHLIITLPTDENMGGAPYLIDNISVDKIYMPLVSLDNALVQNFFNVLKYKKQKLTKIEKGDILELGRAKIHIINVLNREPLNKTDASIAFMLSLEENNFLFTGDLGKEKQKEIDWPDVNVLKIGNLGKDNFNSYELYKKSKPEYIIGTRTEERNIDLNVENLIKTVESEERKDIEFRLSDLKNIIMLKSNGNEINMFEIPYLKEKNEEKTQN